MGPLVFLVYYERQFNYDVLMSTIKAIVEPDADGTIHLPVPAGLRHGKLQITATVEVLKEADSSEEIAGGQRVYLTQCIKSHPLLWRNESNEKEMMEAMEALAAEGAISSIPDSVAWQREQRKDRPLPGRD